MASEIWHQQHKNGGHDTPSGLPINPQGSISEDALDKFYNFSEGDAATPQRPEQRGSFFYTNPYLDDEILINYGSFEFVESTLVDPTSLASNEKKLCPLEERLKELRSLDTPLTVKQRAEKVRIEAQIQRLRK